MRNIIRPTLLFLLVLALALPLLGFGATEDVVKSGLVLTSGDQSLSQRCFWIPSGRTTGFMAVAVFSSASNGIELTNITRWQKAHASTMLLSQSHLKPSPHNRASLVVSAVGAGFGFLKAQITNLSAPASGFLARESSTLLMLGLGLVGTAGLVRKKVKAKSRASQAIASVKLRSPAVVRQ